MNYEERRKERRFRFEEYGYPENALTLFQIDKTLFEE
jgi:hypothetical protein